MDTANHWLGVGDEEARQADHHAVRAAHIEKGKAGIDGYKAAKRSEFDLRWCSLQNVGCFGEQ